MSEWLAGPRIHHAFDVAAAFGASCAQGSRQVVSALKAFVEAIGVSRRTSECAREKALKEWSLKQVHKERSAQGE